MTAILGISAFYHDSATALIIDGDIVFAAQEERYSRKKHDPGFPRHAIEHALACADLSLKDIDAVVFYDKPMLKFERLLETYLANAPFGFLSFARAMPIWLKEKLYFKTLLRRELRQILWKEISSQQGISFAEAKKANKRIALPDLFFTEHHESHAASAFYPSPFEDAAVVCLDGVGEWASSSIWHGKSNRLNALKEMHFPHSLGLLYSAFTYYCGFKVNSGEYKLMGLAPYGKPTYVDLIKTHLINIRDDGSYSLDMSYFDYALGDRMANKKFEQLFDGKPHPFDSEPTQKQMDLAMSIQVVTEEVVLKIAKHAKQLTNSKHLCLAGGVALNCVANGKLTQTGLFDNIWIQPAAGDAGSAVGAALQVWYNWFDKPRTGNAQQSDTMKAAYLGDEFSDEEIEAICSSLSLEYQRLDDDILFEQVATYITEDKVVGWFQGRMEFGPRALGNRTIVGDPRSPSMQSKMNLAIKQRESFRPFAPAVLLEDLTDWFALSQKSPYMLLVADVKTERLLETDDKSGLDQLHQLRSQVPAITHVDNSARVQTVAREDNPRFYQLIESFKAKTQVGMLINTSFNVRGEPPVCTPNDAIRCFLATDMDFLVLGNIVLDKTLMPSRTIEDAKKITFEKD